MYKLMAFQGMLEKKRAKDMEEHPEKTLDYAMSFHSFDQFYQEELLREAQREQQREYKWNEAEY